MKLGQIPWRLIEPVTTSLVGVVCPPQALALGLAPAIVRDFRCSLGSLAPPFRVALQAGLVTYDQTARLWPPARGRRAAKLPPNLGKGYFETWWASALSPRENFARAVKGLLCLGCYECREMRAAIGYTPNEWIDKVRAKRQDRYAEQIASHNADLMVPDPLPPWPEAPRKNA